jgi:hypothetical protein
VDEYEEELGRWMQRARIQQRQLVAGSEQEQQLSRAIRRMEVAQLGRRIQRTQTQLSRLPGRFEERRQLAQALEAMGEEYTAGRAAIYSERSEAPFPVSGSGGRAAAEAREALERASSHLGHPASHAAIRDAITELKYALARLEEELRDR